MKKNNVYYLLFAWLCIAAVSCSKNKADALKENSEVLTNQVEKIETVLAEGATKPDAIIDNLPKIESRASDETMARIRAQMRQEVDETYKKTRVMGVMGIAVSHPRAFGVFKQGSCFGYQQVFVKMDCEDHRPATSSSGWTADSHVDHNDMYLDFCIIDDNYANYMGLNDYGPTNSVVNAAYGFLYLGETLYFQIDPGQNNQGWPQGWRNYFFPWPVAIRVFDNEDGGADNQVWVGGNEVGLTYWMSNSEGSQSAYIAPGNSRLHWIVSPGGAGSSTTRARLSIPGMSQYGLLGKFGPEWGELHTDDEDTNNQNVLEVGGYYNRTNSSSGAGVSSPFPWSYTIEGTDNTWLHLSRVF